MKFFFSQPQETVVRLYYFLKKLKIYITNSLPDIQYPRIILSQ